MPTINAFQICNSPVQCHLQSITEAMPVCPLYAESHLLGGAVRKRKRVDPQSTVFRLMRCVWAVAAEAPEKQFKRADLDTWIDGHPDIITREEYVGRQHSHAWSIISSRAHFVRRINKAIGLHCLTDRGVDWCTKNLVPRGNQS